MVLHQEFARNWDAALQIRTIAGRAKQRRKVSASRFASYTDPAGVQAELVSMVP